MFARLKRALAPGKLATPTPHTAAVDAKRQGDVYLKAGEADTAEQQYRLAITHDPTFARAHFALGYALSQQGLARNAIVPLRTALSIDPGLVDAHYVLGTVLRDEGELAAAIEHFRLIVDLNPDHEFALREFCISCVLQDRTEEAEALVERELARRPVEAELHLLAGNLKVQRGLSDDALTNFRAALKLDPLLAEAHHNIGLVLHSLGRGAEALESHAAAIQARPGYVAAMFASGIILSSSNRHSEALAVYEEIAHIEPESVEAHFRVGLALMALRRPHDALISLERAERLDPGSATTHSNLAAVLFELRRHQEALLCLGRALAIDPEFADARWNRARILVDLGHRDEALADLDIALAGGAARQRIAATSELLSRLGQPERALALLESGLVAEPERLDLVGNRGAVLHHLRRLDEALAAYDQALQGPMRLPEVLSNRGLVLNDLRRYEDALTDYSEAISLNPQFANAHYNEGLCRLVLGDLRAGWQKYEWRWKSPFWIESQGRFGDRQFEHPLWLGESSLEGKTILLHPEQGLGDTIQFSRYAQVLSAMGADVIMEVQPPLKQLLSEVPGASRVLAVGEVLPEHDFHCPFMSLPLACGTTLETVPLAGGYLGSSMEHQERAVHWQAKLGPRTRPRIGIAWSGNSAHKNDANRSLPWTEFSRLLPAGLDVISLQKEVRDGDCAALSADSRVRTFAEDLTDFTETAALIENLDLVVCVDTSVAHLAGALGKSVWMLLPINPDWRWMLNREDSPWYDGLRLFRQGSPGNWNDVLDLIHDELSRLAVAGRTATPQSLGG